MTSDLTIDILLMIETANLWTTEPSSWKAECYSDE